MKPVVVFHTGDLVEDGFNLNQWDNFNKITSRLRKMAEFYPALGNHESYPYLFFNNFDLPGNETWYSVERNNIHFIILDSNSDIAKGSRQYKWLKSNTRKL